MADSFGVQPSSDSSAEDFPPQAPLGINRPLGMKFVIQPKFLTPLGARSLGTLDTSAFLPDSMADYRPPERLFHELPTEQIEEQVTEDSDNHPETASESHLFTATEPLKESSISESSTSEWSEKSYPKSEQSNEGWVEHASHPSTEASTGDAIAVDLPVAPVQKSSLPVRDDASLTNLELGTSSEPDNDFSGVALTQSAPASEEVKHSTNAEFTSNSEAAIEPIGFGHEIGSNADVAPVESAIQPFLAASSENRTVEFEEIAPLPDEADNYQTNVPHLTAPSESIETYTEFASEGFTAPETVAQRSLGSDPAEVPAEGFSAPETVAQRSSKSIETYTEFASEGFSAPETVVQPSLGSDPAEVPAEGFSAPETVAQRSSESIETYTEFASEGFTASETVAQPSLGSDLAEVPTEGFTAPETVAQPSSESTTSTQLSSQPSRSSQSSSSTHQLKSSLQGIYQRFKDIFSTQKPADEPQAKVAATPHHPSTASSIASSSTSSPEQSISSAESIDSATSTSPTIQPYLANQPESWTESELSSGTQENEIFEELSDRSIPLEHGTEANTDQSSIEALTVDSEVEPFDPGIELSQPPNLASTSTSAAVQTYGGSEDNLAEFSEASLSEMVEIQAVSGIDSNPEAAAAGVNSEAVNSPSLPIQQVADASLASHNISQEVPDLNESSTIVPIEIAASNNTNTFAANSIQSDSHTDSTNVASEITAPEAPNPLLLANDIVQQQADLTPKATSDTEVTAPESKDVQPSETSGFASDPIQQFSNANQTIEYLETTASAPNEIVTYDYSDSAAPTEVSSSPNFNTEATTSESKDAQPSETSGFASDPVQQFSNANQTIEYLETTASAPNDIATYDYSDSAAPTETNSIEANALANSQFHQPATIKGNSIADIDYPDQETTKANESESFSLEDEQSSNLITSTAHDSTGVNDLTAITPLQQTADTSQKLEISESELRDVAIANSDSVEANSSLISNSTKLNDLVEPESVTSIDIPDASGKDTSTVETIGVTDSHLLNAVQRFSDPENKSEIGATETTESIEAFSGQESFSSDHRLSDTGVAAPSTTGFAAESASDAIQRFETPVAANTDNAPEAEFGNDSGVQPAYNTEQVGELADPIVEVPDVSKYDQAVVEVGSLDSRSSNNSQPTIELESDSTEASEADLTSNSILDPAIVVQQYAEPSLEHSENIFGTATDYLPDSIEIQQSSKLGLDSSGDEQYGADSNSTAITNASVMQQQVELDLDNPEVNQYSVEINSPTITNTSIVQQQVEPDLEDSEDRFVTEAKRTFEGETEHNTETLFGSTIQQHLETELPYETDSRITSIANPSSETGTETVTSINSSTIEQSTPLINLPSVEPGFDAVNSAIDPGTSPTPALQRFDASKSTISVSAIGSATDTHLGLQVSAADSVHTNDLVSDHQHIVEPKRPESVESLESAVNSTTDTNFVTDLSEPAETINQAIPAIQQFPEPGSLDLPAVSSEEATSEYELLNDSEYSAQSEVPASEIAIAAPTIQRSPEVELATEEATSEYELLNNSEYSTQPEVPASEIAIAAPTIQRSPEVELATEMEYSVDTVSETAVDLSVQRPPELELAETSDIELGPEFEPIGFSSESATDGFTTATPLQRFTESELIAPAFTPELEGTDDIADAGPTSTQAFTPEPTVAQLLAEGNLPQLPRTVKNLAHQIPLGSTQPLTSVAEAWNNDGLPAEVGFNTETSATTPVVQTKAADSNTFWSDAAGESSATQLAKDDVPESWSSIEELIGLSNVHTEPDSEVEPDWESDASSDVSEDVISDSESSSDTPYFRVPAAAAYTSPIDTFSTQAARSPVVQRAAAPVSSAYYEPIQFSFEAPEVEAFDFNIDYSSSSFADTPIQKKDSPTVSDNSIPQEQPQGFAAAKSNVPGQMEYVNNQLITTVENVVEQTLPKEEKMEQDEGNLETLAREIYSLLRQRLEIERERRNGLPYSGRLPW